MKTRVVVRADRIGTAALSAALLCTACRGRAAAANAPAMVTGSNGQVVIPEGSPLRSALVVRYRPGSAVERCRHSDGVGRDRSRARTVKLFPPMAGRVVAVHAQLGDMVHRGDPLITLDAPDFTSAQADLAHAVTAYRQAKNNLARERDLAAYGIAAQRDVEQAETDFCAGGRRSAPRGGSPHVARASTPALRSTIRRW